MELPQAVQPCMMESLVSLHSSFTALLWLFPLQSHRPSFWPMNSYGVRPSRTFGLACSCCCSIRPPNTHWLSPSLLTPLSLLSFPLPSFLSLSLLLPHLFFSYGIYHHQIHTFPPVFILSRLEYTFLKGKGLCPF